MNPVKVSYWRKAPNEARNGQAHKDGFCVLDSPRSSSRKKGVWSPSELACATKMFSFAGVASTLKQAEHDARRGVTRRRPRRHLTYSLLVQQAALSSRCVRKAAGDCEQKKYDIKIDEAAD